MVNERYFLFDLLDAVVHKVLTLSGPPLWQICAQSVSPAQVGWCTGHSPHSRGMFDTQAKTCCCAEHDNLLVVLCFHRKGFRKNTFSHYLQKTWERAGLCSAHMDLTAPAVWVLVSLIWCSLEGNNSDILRIKPGKPLNRQDKRFSWIRGIVQIKQYVIPVKHLPWCSPGARSWGEIYISLCSPCSLTKSFNSLIFQPSNLKKCKLTRNGHELCAHLIEVLVRSTGYNSTSSLKLTANLFFFYFNSAWETLFQKPFRSLSST